MNMTGHPSVTTLQTDVAYIAVSEQQVGSCDVDLYSVPNPRWFQTDEDVDLGPWLASLVARLWLILVRLWKESRGTPGPEGPEPGTSEDHLQSLLLRQTIGDLRAVLDSEQCEAEVQSFLTTHPMLLCPVALDVIPQHRVGGEYVVDFVIRRPSGDYSLVEIERPKHRLFTKAGRTAAALNRALKQLEDWLGWVRDNLSYARKNLPGITDPDGIVLIGRMGSPEGQDDVWLRQKNRVLQCITIRT